LNPDYLTAVTIKQTNLLGLFRLKNTFQILSVVLACLIAAVFPGKVAAGEAGQDEKNASSQTSNLTQTNEYPDLRLNKDLFKRYLENPYPVREVVFFKPWSAFNNLTDMLLCEGSLQPDMFYIRQQASPKVLEDGKYKNVSTGEVAGKSSTGEYWFVDSQAVRGKGGTIYITSAGDPDSSVTTLAKERALESLPKMLDACWFGLSFMVPHSVVWHGDDFDMRFRDDSGYPHTTNTYAVSGEVLAYTNNLPLVIRIKSEDWPRKDLVSLDFRYEYDFSQEDRFYPVKITKTIVHSVNNRYSVPIQILKIEFGDVKPAENGYAATNFTQAEIATPADVYVSSNQTIYWVNGHQQIRVGPPPVFKKPLFTINTYVRVILIVLLLLPAAFLVRWQKKSKSKKN
jgi:hypothetical protein